VYKDRVANDRTHCPDVKSADLSTYTYTLCLCTSPQPIHGRAIYIAQLALTGPKNAKTPRILFLCLELLFILESQVSSHRCKQQKRQRLIAYLHVIRDDGPSSFDRRRGLGVAKGAELEEDGNVLDHGAKGANQPREVGEEVLFLLGVEHDLHARTLAGNSTPKKKSPCKNGGEERYLHQRHTWRFRADSG
jgi:hypothetical protein